MTFFTSDNLRAVTGGRWLRRPEGTRTASGVGTDTREDLTDRIFIALRGVRFDGHDHLATAQAAGAVMALIEREVPAPPDLPVLLVPDTKRALALLAGAYRRTLVATKVIAITGSCGKTTTKELVHALLSSRFPGSAAPRSFNNDIGVPLTLLAARPHEKYLIVEVGSSAPGEIAHLARLVEPDIAVITCVGRSHLEGLGSVDAVAAEKASLLASLRPGGLAVVTADAPALAPFVGAGPSVVRFGVDPGADLRLTSRGPAGGDDGRWWFEVNARTRFGLALPGLHNATNAIAAVAIGRRFGLDDAVMSEILAGVAAAPMRMAVETIAWPGRGGRPSGDVTILDDAYNANPDSMIAALDTFIEVAARAPRRLVVLGDMLELGAHAKALHRELGLYVIDVDSRRSLEHAFLVGPAWAEGETQIRRVWPATRVTRRAELDASMISAIRDRIRPGDAVLVKGSRGIGLERLVAALRAEVRPAVTDESRTSTPMVEIADGAREGAPRVGSRVPPRR